MLVFLNLIYLQIGITGPEKKLEFQLPLGTSISQILLALGKS